MSKLSKKVALAMMVSMIVGTSVVPSKAEVVSSLDTAEESFFGPASGTSDATSDNFFDNSSQNGASSSAPVAKQEDTTSTSTPASKQENADTTVSAPTTSTSTETTNSNNTYYYYYTVPTTAPTTSAAGVTDTSEKITLNGTTQTTAVNDTTYIVLNRPQIATVVGGKRVATVALKRAVTGADGYQIQICKSKKFKSGVTQLRTVLTTKSVAVKSSGLRYVRVRAYKIVDGKNVYSAWSAVKTVKIKK